MYNFKTVAFFFWSLLYLHLYPFAEAISESCQIEPIPNGRFDKTSAISKYFTVSSSVVNSLAQTYDEAKAICESAGLEMAEIESMVDLNSLRLLIDEGDTPYWIGMKDSLGNGIFKNAQGQPISFQTFGLGDPSQDGTEENCVQLTTASGTLRMEDEPCNKKSGVLCQYQAGSYCSIQSYQSSASNVIGGPESLIKLGSSSNVYVSTFQMPFEDSVVECIKMRKMPLTLHQNSTLSLELIRNLRDHLIDHDLDDQTQFWIGGKLIRDASEHYNGEVVWEVLEKTYDLVENPYKISYQWGPGQPRDNLDNGCIDISYVSDSHPMLWQSSNCRMPKFFLCMDSDAKISAKEYEKRLQQIALDDVDINASKIKGKAASLATMSAGDINTKEEVNECVYPVLKHIEPIKLNMTSPMVINETLDIMMYILKNNVKNGKNRVKVKKSIQWKRDLFDSLFDIFMKAVGPEFVPYEYLHIAREINLLYQNAVQKNASNATPDFDFESWEMGILPVLDACLENTVPYPLETEGLELKFFGPNTLVSPKEEADVNHFDIFLDTLWHVFAFSVGECYTDATKFQNDPLIWASKYYISFTSDILTDLMDKWTNEDVANIMKAGLIAGDVDVVLAINNLRTAVVVPYLENDILDRQLVRPLSNVRPLDNMEVVVDEPFNL